VVAESVPRAGESDQVMVEVLPVRVAVKGAGAPPAVTVAVVGLTVSVGTTGLTVRVAVAVSVPAVAVSVTVSALATEAGGV
jgi:hypothetical protein